MSKWINKDLFSKFQEEKIEEKDNPNQGGNGSSFRQRIWKPEKGSEEQPKTFIGRFLPDEDSNFYVKFFYHMFKIGDNWNFFLCPKTHDFNAYCPWCSATMKLYQGTQAEKNIAYTFKRKTKFVSNFFIISDPRDQDKDDENKVTGKVMLYEFPEKVEKLIKNEIVDREEGIGYAAFDPGKTGYNFVLKVFSTKMDKNKKVWPDYGSSKFSRKAEAIGSEKEIDEIMKTTVKLSEYLESLERDDDVYKKALKDSMLWELVEDDWNRIKGVDIDDTSEKDSNDHNPDYGKPKVDMASEENVSQKKEDDNKSDDDFSEEDLLKELDDLAF